MENLLSKIRKYVIKLKTCINFITPLKIELYYNKFGLMFTIVIFNNDGFPIISKRYDYIGGYYQTMNKITDEYPYNDLIINNEDILEATSMMRILIGEDGDSINVSYKI